MLILYYWKNKWQPNLVFLPGKSHGQKSLAGCCPWSCKRIRHNLVTKFSSVQFSCSVVSDSLRPHELQHARPPCASPTGSSPRLMSVESVMPSSHLILCRPLLLLPPFPPSIWVFSNESTLHMRWPKYWSFSFSIN